MKGYIDKSLVPKIENIFIVGRSELIPIEPVLDTGFNDEFAIPRKYFNACDLEFFGKEDYILANGNAVEDDVYFGELIIDNKRLRVFMSLTEDDEALVGTRLLDEKVVILNFKNYRIDIQA